MLVTVQRRYLRETTFTALSRSSLMLRPSMAKPLMTSLHRSAGHAIHLIWIQSWFEHEMWIREGFYPTRPLYQVRLHPSMISHLEHVAVYRTAPVSAITHYAPIRSIEPRENTGKMVTNFAEPAREIRPLRLTKNGRVKHLQGLRYTKFDRMKSATSLDEAF